MLYLVSGNDNAKTALNNTLFRVIPCPTQTEGAWIRVRFWTTYETTVQDVTGLLPAGAEGINHGTLNQSAYSDLDLTLFLIGIGTDGVVKVLTVKIV